MTEVVDGNDDADDDAEVVDGNACTRPVMTYKLSVVAGEYAQPEQRSFLCSTMFCHLDLSRLSKMFEYDNSLPPPRPPSACGAFE